MAAVMVAAAVAVIAAGCGAGPLRTSTPTTIGSNHRRALAETRHLLSAVEVPSGAQRSASPGAPQLDTPLNGTLAGATDGRRYWRIHEPYRTAIAWLDGHAPAGSHPAASTTTSHGTVTSRVGGYVYFPPANAAWQQAQLSLEATPVAPDVTAVRADAQVQWTVATPYPDRSRGRRLHLLAAGPCPATSAPYADVANAGPGLGTSLLPPGKVTAALVCRYGEPEPRTHPNLRLTLTRELPPRAAAHLAARARRVPVGHPASRPPAGCAVLADPMRIIVAFGYADGRVIDLWVQPTACPAREDNGTITVIDDGSLGAALQHAVPAIGATT